MDERVKALVESAEEITAVRKRGGQGRWDIEGLMEALKQMFPSKPGARKVKLESVMAFHSTGEIKNKAHYAKKAIERAVEELGWKLKGITSYKSGDRQYIEFEVDF